jgi:hypothetical protein
MTKLLNLILMVAGFAMSGCHTGRTGGELHSGVRYSITLTNGIVGYIASEKGGGGFDIYLSRGDFTYGQFGVAADGGLTVLNCTIDSDGKDGGTYKAIDVSIMGGKLRIHHFERFDGKIREDVFDRDGDFYPDERMIYDTVTHKKIRESINHEFIEFQGKKDLKE